MRKFTKDHNDLLWLFPLPVKFLCSSGRAENYFDDYEEYGQHLMNSRYGKEKIEFDRDDMMDAFMKGASHAHQIVSCDCFGWMNKVPIDSDKIEMFNEHFAKLEDLIKSGKSKEALDELIWLRSDFAYSFKDESRNF